MKHANAIALTLATALCARAEVYTFDFGTKDSPLRPGALRVTEKGGERAAWSAPNACQAKASPIAREWAEDAHSGRKTPPASYVNDLTCDFVTSAEGQTLTLGVPAGAYRLLLLCGRAGGAREQVWNVAVGTSAAPLAAAGGASPPDCHTSGGVSVASHTFAGPCALRAIIVDATAGAEGLTLDLRTRSRWLLNALIAAPAAEWGDAKKKLIDPLLAECFTLPPEELAKWKETPQRADAPEPQWTEAQRTGGIAVFTRPWCEPVWPSERPRQHELDAPVRAFASPGEYEPLTFALHPLADFARATVTLAGPLVCEADGARASIAATNIDVRLVRYMNVRPNYSTFFTYYRAPDVLMPARPQALEKGENLRAWLTVRVPPGQRPGRYAGEARVDADGLSLRVPLALRVLPIDLLRDRSLGYGLYYHHPHRNLDRAPDEFSRRWWQRKAEAEHADMREHGMNTVVLGLGGFFKDGRCVYHFDRLQRDLDLARAAGFDRPTVCSFPFSELYRKHMANADLGSHLRLVKMPPDAFFDELTEMVRTIEAEARKRQWPELLYYPVDEPSTSPESVAFMARVMAAIKRVPKVRTYVTADPEHEQFAPLRPAVDVWCCQPFSLGRDAVLADMKARGVEYWCYPNHIAGENDHTPTLGARMTYGFGFWQSGYRCLMPWIYQADIGDPWNYLDGANQDFFNRTDDDGSPIPVALWEAYREGIDDGRYLFTLETAIARAEAAGFKSEAAKARAVIERLNAALPVQPKYKADGLWSGEAFDAWRWALAEQIIALQATAGR